MTTDQTMLPSVFTVKQLVKEKLRKFKRKVKLIEKACIGTDRNSSQINRLANTRFLLEVQLVKLLERSTGYPRLIDMAYAYDSQYNYVSKYFAFTTDKALRTNNYENIQKCLIIAKCIIESQIGQDRVVKAEMFSGIFTDELARFSKSHAMFIAGKLTYLVSGRFNSNWKKPMIVVKTLRDKHVVITEHSIDVTKYAVRTDKTKLTVDLV